MRRAFLATTVTVAATIFGLAGCGDDDQNNQNCGAGTVLVNGQCVANPTDTTGTDATSPDTSTPADTVTTTPTDTAVATTTTAETTVDTVVTLETTGECTPEEAGKGFVGAPCTKDCQCRQDAGGAPLECYTGMYMEGFSFCTKVAEFNPPVGAYEVTTIQLVKGCFPNHAGNAEINTKVYAAVCNTLEDCKNIGDAYDACGTSTANFPWSTGSGTQCKNFEQSGTGSTMTLRKTCIVKNTVPFNQQ